ncbi:ABC transporter permease [Nemorincola caseinilytica]|uniref:ABC transporter permease n=1 Tax=Nemorincola caseinilytica TaxID=2054315 RepID=A0ABP8NNF6_9BACT
MQLFFNAVLAFRAIRTNKLRSSLTIAIIGLGIMALVGILTAIEVMKASIYSNFSSMGVNTFQITSEILKKKKHKGGGVNVTVVDGKSITYEEAKMFRERYRFPSEVGVSFGATDIATVQYRSQKTNPNIRVVGGDEAYLGVSDTKLEAGRNFSVAEVQMGGYVCILGNGVAKKLFKNKLREGINQIVSVGNMKCRVIGIMETKGGSMIMNADNKVVLPLLTARSQFGESDDSYLLSIKIDNINQKDLAAEEAEGVFRVIRKLPLGTENNFSITQNNDLVEIVMDSIVYISLAAVIIGIITLLGSVIGLMNIMLVSVAERTREIGVSKALGARSSTIKQQFLTESVLISLLGGITGIILGILLGNSVGGIFGTGFVVPWLWMGMGVTLCALVGIISGIYPAIKASKLDPIVALRYE